MNNNTLEAELYDWHNSFALKRQSADVDYFINQLQIYHPTNALVVGAGTGRVAIPLSLHTKVTALDIDNERLVLLKSKNKNIETINIDITIFNTKNMYDLVIAPYSTLQLIRTELLIKCFSNIYNALKAGGMFIFDLSRNFDIKPDTEWSTVIEEYCDTLKMDIIEEQKNIRSTDYISIKKRYSKKLNHELILEIEEKWYYCNEEMLSRIIEKTGFHIKKIDSGYLDGKSNHRLIYHCKKDYAIK